MIVILLAVIVVVLLFGAAAVLRTARVGCGLALLVPALAIAVGEAQKVHGWVWAASAIAVFCLAAVVWELKRRDDRAKELRKASIVEAVARRKEERELAFQAKLPELEEKWREQRQEEERERYRQSVQQARLRSEQRPGS